MKEREDEMGVSYYLHYSCVPCSLCSVPVFHWFHVPSSCVLVCITLGIYLFLGFIDYRSVPVPTVSLTEDKQLVTRHTTHRSPIPDVGLFSVWKTTSRCSFIPLSCYWKTTVTERPPTTICCELFRCVLENWSLFPFPLPHIQNQ